MADAKPGDRIRLITTSEAIEGILMPTESKESAFIKLDNGYNIGIDNKKIKKIELIEKISEEKKKKAKIIVNKNLPTISILHTGGTIASKVDYRTGGVVARFDPEELLEMFPELREIANIRSKLISNMFSEDIRFAHYRLMAKAIKEEIDGSCDGIILTHGTDTMTYTAAALAFMLENLPIPVILVGSQRSSDRGSSDASVNLICAAEFITKTDFSGVAICMHATMDDDKCAILPATKTRKMHTSRRDAFKAINDSPIAVVDYKTRGVEIVKKVYNKKDKNRRLALKDKIEDKVGILKAHPNMVPEQFEFYKGYKGLVIEALALGQLPINAPNDESKPNLKNKKALKELIDSGCLVVITSQCIFGRVHPHVYSTAIDIEQMGAIYLEDMLTETAFIKLAWLLGNYSKEDAKDLMRENIKGEINERILPDEYLE